MEIDIYEYMDNYLKVIEERIIAKKEEIPNFSAKLIHQAVMNEMKSAEEETGKIEIPDNKEDALKQAEERILKFLKDNIDIDSKGDIETDASLNHTTKTKTVKISQNLSWEATQTGGDDVSFKCVGCSKNHNLQIGLFANTQPKPDKGLIKTSQFINIGTTIAGNVVAFIVAVVLGTIISLVSGKIGVGIAIIAAVIFLILRKIFIPTFLDRLPVWAYECSHCRNKIFIASDGSKVFIGKA